MITLELYPLEQQPKRIGTIYDTRHGLTVAIAYEYKSKLAIRRYLCGLEPPNYQVPAIITEIAIWRNHIAFYKDMNTEPFKMWIGN